MNGKDWIKIKQFNWAKRNGIKADKRSRFYTKELKDNLYLDGLTVDTAKEFQDADGVELHSKDELSPKMYALHSSSALAVNVFDYWRQEDKSVLPIMVACNLVSSRNSYEYGLEFERKFDILGAGSRPANVDVVFSEVDSKKLFILESKFSEPYHSKNQKMKEKYFEDEMVWDNLQHLWHEAKSLEEYKYLDAGQLIKHLLGALKESGYIKKNITLGYIYYDVLGKEGKAHYDEILRFEKAVKADGIRFKHIIYQEVIAKLIRDYYVENQGYCDYLADRYL